MTVEEEIIWSEVKSLIKELMPFQLKRLGFPGEVPPNLQKVLEEVKSQKVVETMILEKVTSLLEEIGNEENDLVS